MGFATVLASSFLLSLDAEELLLLLPLDADELLLLLLLFPLDALELSLPLLDADELLLLDALLPLLLGFSFGFPPPHAVIMDSAITAANTPTARRFDSLIILPPFSRKLIVPHFLLFYPFFPLFVNQILKFRHSMQLSPAVFRDLLKGKAFLFHMEHYF